MPFEAPWRQGEVGDGKIFIVPIDDVIRIQLVNVGETPFNIMKA